MLIISYCSQVLAVTELLRDITVLVMDFPFLFSHMQPHVHNGTVKHSFSE